MFRDKNGLLRPMVPQRRESNWRDEERRAQLKRKMLEDEMEENARKNAGTDEERAAKEAYKREREEAAKKKAEEEAEEKARKQAEIDAEWDDLFATVLG